MDGNYLTLLYSLAVTKLHFLQKNYLFSTKNIQLAIINWKVGAHTVIQIRHHICISKQCFILMLLKYMSLSEKNKRVLLLGIHWSLKFRRQDDILQFSEKETLSSKQIHLYVFMKANHGMKTCHQFSLKGLERYLKWQSFEVSFMWICKLQNLISVVIANLCISRPVFKLTTC